MHLQAHVEDIKKTHLRELMSDTERCKSMMVYDAFLALFVFSGFLYVQKV